MRTKANATPKSTEFGQALANGWRWSFGQCPKNGHSSANAWPMADGQWPEKVQSSAKTWTNASHRTMIGRISAAWDTS
ncbi:unnamed protein product [Ixodes pacificus]